MKRWFFVAGLLLALTGCDSPARTVSTTRKQLAAYQAAPNPEKQAAVEQSLAKLDDQIGELDKKGDGVQADLFRRQASSLRTDFQAVRMAKAINNAQNAIRGLGEAFQDAGKSFSETFKNSRTNNP